MSKIQLLNEIQVGLNFGSETINVGRLAMRDRTIYFEYSQNIIDSDLEISPLHLPLKPGLSSFDRSLFEGLAGVFNDCLPDGWGRLLFERFVRSQGIVPAEVTPLQRLAYIGQNNMGALVFEPNLAVNEAHDIISLDIFAKQAQDVLDGTSDEVLQELLALNGSSAGARPKALIGVDQARKKIIHGVNDLPVEYLPWMVKFANSQDGPDAGAIEYVYALMAIEAGINIPDVHLFPAQKNAGFFAVKRFDRDLDKRYHMHSACGLLHSDFRIPSLDYEDLILLTGMLTRDIREVEKMYQMSVFNVLAHNRDDHAKNFSFLMDEQGQWLLSPAYDLTFSSGPRGEQSTMVMGEGRNPTIAHLIKLGLEAKISKNRVDEIIKKSQASLSKWPKLAKTHGVSSANIKLIMDKLNLSGF